VTGEGRRGLGPTPTLIRASLYQGQVGRPRTKTSCVAAPRR